MELIWIGPLLPAGPVAIDAAGGYLATACQAGTNQYRLYELADLTSFERLRLGEPKDCQYLAFGGSGRFLAAAEFGFDYFVQGWVYDLSANTHHNIRAGGKQGTYQVVYGGVRGGSDFVAFGADSESLILSGSRHQAVVDLNGLVADGALHFIDPGKSLYRESVPSLPWSPDGALARISDFSPDSRWLAVGPDSKKGSLQILDRQSATVCCQSEPLPSEATVLRFSPSGEHLISGHKDGVLALWKLTVEGTPQLTLVESVRAPGEIVALGVAPGNVFFAAKVNKKSVGVGRVHLAEAVALQSSTHQRASTAEMPAEPSVTARQPAASPRIEVTCSLCQKVLRGYMLAPGKTILVGPVAIVCIGCQQAYCHDHRRQLGWSRWSGYEAAHCSNCRVSLKAGSLVFHDRPT